MLNKIGLSMEPCGTPDKKILKILSASFSDQILRILKLRI